MSEQIKPCPFCGGEAHIYETSQDSDAQVQAQCKGCGAEIAFWLPWTAGSGQKVAAYADVERRWNTRADLSEAAIAAARAEAHIITDADIEKVAAAWASMDGKAEWFWKGKNSPEVEAAMGHYAGYMEDARELLCRSGLLSCTATFTIIAAAGKP